MVSEDDIAGYTVAYEREDIAFPIYAMTTIAAALVIAGIVQQLPILIGVALLPAAVAYYNLPLLETGRPRLGAGQYGLFIEGLGLLSWRAIAGIELVETHDRGVPTHELHIAVKQSISEALLADWRSRPLIRRFMRLPWSASNPALIRIPLDILDRPAGEIHDSLLRQWRYNRSR